MAIKCKDINFIYQPNTEFAKQALTNINLEIQEEIITAVIGNTGSGKSSLIQLFNGIERPTSGEINILDTWNIKKRNKIKKIKHLRQKVGVVFQFAEYQLFQDTVWKDIIFGYKNLIKTKGKSKLQTEEYKDIVKKYLKLVGLPQNIIDKNPFELSGGQKRRVAIAGILAMDPDIIIFDEPTAGLDPSGEHEIIKIIQSLKNKFKKTVVFVTHNMNHVLEIADQVIVMRDGLIKKIASPFTIFHDLDLIKDNDLLLPTIYQLIHDAKLINKLKKYENDIRNIEDLTKFISWTKKDQYG